MENCKIFFSYCKWDVSWATFPVILICLHPSQNQDGQVCCRGYGTLICLWRPHRGQKWTGQSRVLLNWWMCVGVTVHNAQHTRLLDEQFDAYVWCSQGLPWDRKGGRPGSPWALPSSCLLSCPTGRDAWVQYPGLLQMAAYPILSIGICNITVKHRSDHFLFCRHTTTYIKNYKMIIKVCDKTLCLCLYNVVTHSWFVTVVL